MLSRSGAWRWSGLQGPEANRYPTSVGLAFGLFQVRRCNHPPSGSFGGSSSRAAAAVGLEVADRRRIVRAPGLPLTAHRLRRSHAGGWALTRVRLRIAHRPRIVAATALVLTRERLRGCHARLTCIRHVGGSAMRTQPIRTTRGARGVGALGVARALSCRILTLRAHVVGLGARDRGQRDDEGQKQLHDGLP